MKRHKAATYAQWRYGHTFDDGGTFTEIWESLDPHQKQVCRMAVNDIMDAPDEEWIENEWEG